MFIEGSGKGFTVIAKEELSPLPQILCPLTVILPETAEVP